MKALREAVTNLNLEVEHALSEAPSTTPTTTPSSPPAEPTHSHATLRIDLPSFDGSPENWEQFETLFLSTARTRAKGFSPMELRGLLRNAVKPDRARRILDNLPSTSTSLEEMLGELKTIYGSPAVVGPIIVQKILSSPKLEFDYQSLSSFHDNFCLPWKRFCSSTDGSLSTFLAILAVSRMNDSCRDEWLRTADSDKVPQMEDVNAFVKKWMTKFPGSSNRHPTPSSSNLHLHPSPTPSSAHHSKPSHPRSEHHHSPSKKLLMTCHACGQQHGLVRCESFRSLSVDARTELVKKHKLCMNCFSSAHGYRACPGRFSCKTCNGRHHTLLHREPTPSSVPSLPSTTTDVIPVASMTAATNAPSSRSLLTALVNLRHDGNIYHARAILDTGAAISFMTEAAASALRLKRTFQPLQVTGTTGEGQCKFAVTTSIMSSDGQYISQPIRFAIVPELPKLQVPSNSSEILTLPTFRTYRLADPKLGGSVDILLGVHDCLQMITGPAFQVQGLSALPTQLGLCLSGQLQSSESALALVATIPPTDLQDDLTKLWELDRVPESPELSSEDQQVINDFHQSYSLRNGRFSVSLPRTADPPQLGESRRQAVSRLLQNEKSLTRKGKLEAFQTAVREYVDLGHAHVIPNHQLRPPDNHFYLPVHGVFKDSSSTTKVRAVFDASARTTSTFSLNDTLLPGPNLYPPLTDILLRFRKFPIAMSADISKMFREILLNPIEKDFHRFVMRDAADKIVDCRMDRLTFGVKSSPFLATQVLHTLASLHASSHPSAANAITHNFYVDDFLAGAESVVAASSLQRELSDLLSKAGMVLRKWRSNSSELLSTIPDSLHDESSSLLIPTPSMAPKALGVHWNVAQDTLHVSIPPIPPSTKDVTKRQIASATAGVFDVLGLFSPAILPARILLQETWKRSLPWDSPIPDDLSESWSTWVADLPSLNIHSIPRQLSCPNALHEVELHGFCDASSRAYGASIYLRNPTQDGTASVTLLTAKARVLPVKPVTIPKAELLGAHLLAKMVRHTAAVLDIPCCRIHAWTDSEIVLHWLPKAPPQLDRFVANRVHAIQELLPDVTWRHVPTSSNPADLASRGVRAPDLAMSALWWSGPPWLSLHPSQWPATKLSKPVVPALVATIRLPSTPSPTVLSFVKDLWKRFSDFFHLVRVCALVYRFLHNCKACKDSRIVGPLSYEEIVKAKAVVYRLAQSEAYHDVFPAVRNSVSLPKSHQLHKFHLSLSEHGHLLALTRIRDPQSPSSPTALTVLPKSSELTQLLLRSLHIAYSHAGVSAMHSIVSHSFLIPSLRSCLKRISRSCIICQKAYAKPLAHTMGLLPSVRTTPAPPFAHTGVDFAGPFMLRVGHTRKPSYIKTYAVVFVCMVTKAVHLDLAASLSTKDFLATLERFVSRRGAPSVIYSDNGSNFIGAREDIRELQRLTGSRSTKEAIQHFSSQHAIEWKMIPPRAPHFGGLWEAAVKSMKIHLRKTTKVQRLRWDELYTILTAAEAMMNSRPLAPIHKDEAEESTYLTAGHFLVGRPLLALPARTPSTSPTTHLRRWNLVNRLKADLWRNWTSSYLSSVAHRTKWLHPSRQLKPGDLVFVKDEALGVQDWPIARVTHVHPGDDGINRVVDIVCRGRTYRRPVVKLILALTDEDLENPSTSTNAEPIQQEE